MYDSQSRNEKLYLVQRSDWYWAIYLDFKYTYLESNAYLDYFTRKH